MSICHTLIKKEGKTGKPVQEVYGVVHSVTSEHPIQ